MLRGEQPDDQEELSGKPFLGAAGQILDRALGEAGIDRNSIYVTNTVKHFKWIAAWETTYPPKTEFPRHRRLSFMARSGIAGR